MREEIRDGLRRAISAMLQSPERSDYGGWVSLEPLHATQSIISQVTCRLIVGKVLARDSEFIQSVADFSYSVILWSIVLVLRLCGRGLQVCCQLRSPKKRFQGLSESILLITSIGHEKDRWMGRTTSLNM